MSRDRAVVGDIAAHAIDGGVRAADGAADGAGRVVSGAAAWWTR